MTLGERDFRRQRHLGHLGGVAAEDAPVPSHDPGESPLGLAGLAAFTTQQRRKEIGVRKVLGASEGSIIALLSKEIALLVLAAAVVALPLAYFAATRWLEGFAYRMARNALPGKGSDLLR